MTGPAGRWLGVVRGRGGRSIHDGARKPSQRKPDSHLHSCSVGGQQAEMKAAHPTRSSGVPTDGF